MFDPYKLQLDDLKNRDPKYLETIFSIGNGHFGSRATDPLKPTHNGGTVINGFYESSPIIYGEQAYGYAKNHQTIINLPDLRSIQIAEGDGQFFATEQLISQTLNLKTGIMTTESTLTSPSGHRIRLVLQAILGQHRQQAAAFRYTLTALNFSGPVRMAKQLWLDAADTQSDDPRLARSVQTLNFTHSANESGQQVVVTTDRSQLQAGIKIDVPAKWELTLDESISNSFDVLAAVGPIVDAAAAYPELALPESFDILAEDAQTYWNKTWANGNVEITGDDALAQGIHYNLFQLNSSAGRDGLTNIAAKGVSGTGYEGHYFWDTEMYMLPYFTLTNPTIARNLLAYRYHVLPAAKKRARELGVDHGALFAWRTINGEEASAYYPAGTAQYHINGDIAYAIGQYFAATGDFAFMRDMGFEILLETAKFWANFGSWFTVHGESHFGFFDVTGPDEYTAIVDNNFYTNKIAQHNLQLVVAVARAFEKAGQAIPLGVTESDLTELARIAKGIYLPVDDALKIHPQDDSFLKKPRWPFATTPKDKYPLLLHFHPLTIYRYQVNKQADTLLADYLFPDSISDSQTQRDYAYYEPVTTHDSSLSRAIFSAVAARLGMADKAYAYFTDTARMDLVDLQGNAADGLHLANLGGSWLSIITGFAGVKYTGAQLSVTNHLPEQWESLAFIINYQGRVLKFTLTHGTTIASLEFGEPIDVVIDGHSALVS
ncbi:glycoside hydrolase family 65 protein [Schleiferilactobacillus harbinensis]|uniref:glycoside hydrolase family 65 protein n=1 Tax=Schleiferilactobacillus harbinensis TaxID=304207 RepID=UPI0021A679B7|nr:glycosyl hydrolase family 65 protein [Schleiferilactobacillus harbinensis]MCT2909680.1 glycoside hydrolase family 65 protein [Schleiferilactobacillus harbinensis]